MNASLVQPTPQRIWRSTQSFARHLDRTEPYWWNDFHVLHGLFRIYDPIRTRCWVQLVRQRRGY